MLAEDQRERALVVSHNLRIGSEFAQWKKRPHLQTLIWSRMGGGPLAEIRGRVGTSDESDGSLNQERRESWGRAF
jgi:hypothetical protein